MAVTLNIQIFDISLYRSPHPSADSQNDPCAKLDLVVVDGRKGQLTSALKGRAKADVFPPSDDMKRRRCISTLGWHEEATRREFYGIRWSDSADRKHRPTHLRPHCIACKEQGGRFWSTHTQQILNAPWLWPLARWARSICREKGLLLWRRWTWKIKAKLNGRRDHFAMLFT